MSKVVEVQDGVTQVTEFGVMPDGTKVDLFTVWNGRAHASFTSYGARVVSVGVKDRRKRVADVVLGYDSLAMYLADSFFMGATIGRFANRIAGGKFTLNGVAFQVPVNNGPNALHGGPEGFDQKVWSARTIEHGVEFSLESPDGDMGFPGALRVVVRYTFVDDVLTVAYEAVSDADTVINLTNHSYFNLQGERSADVRGHVVRIPAETFTPVDANLIPTGELAQVAGTPFDLRTGEAVGRRWEREDEQLTLAGGFDHNYAFGEPGVMKMVAEVFQPDSGRTLTVETTEPGLQLYTGNFLDGSMPDRNGERYEKRYGLCLETQHYPDSPNQPSFPTTELKAGETFRSTTTYTFGVRAISLSEAATEQREAAKAGMSARLGDKV